MKQMKPMTPTGSGISVVSVSSVQSVDGQGSRGRRWLRAIDPPIYVVGLFPPLIGAAATNSLPSTPPPLWIWAFPVAGFLLLHGATNVANDAFDAATPADRVKRHSMARLTAPARLLWAAALLALLAAACGLVPWLRHPTWTVPALAAAGLLMLYAYHGPPLRLSHYGLGEVVTFLGFGPIPVMATAALVDGTMQSTALMPGLLAGLAAVVVLQHHNVASRENDAAGGKRTLAVRLGPRGAPCLELVLAATVVVGVASWIGIRTIPGVATLVILAALATVAHLGVRGAKSWTRASSLGLYSAASVAILLRLAFSG